MAPAAYAADASTGGAIAPAAPAEIPTAPAPVPAPAAPLTGAPSAPAPPAPTPVAPAPPVPVAQAVPLAATPEAAARAAPEPARPPTARLATPTQLAAIVRDSPPLRTQRAITAQDGDVNNPEVVKVPVPRPKAPSVTAPAVPATVARLPHTGFDLGLMCAMALGMVGTGLMILAILTPVQPPVRTARERRS